MKNLIVNATIALIMAAHESQITPGEADRRIQDYRRSGRLSDEEYEAACRAADLIKMEVEKTSRETLGIVN